MVAVGSGLQAQGMKSDERPGVGLVVDIVGLEGGVLLGVHRPIRLAALDHNVSLVEPDAGGAGDVLLHVIHEFLQQFTLRGVPEAVVNGGGVPGDQAVAQAQHLPIESE